MILDREAGILLHITSLPARFGIGDLGPEAYKFVDFLQETGQKLWQTLPIGPTGFTNSPYACLSAIAGNPELISFEKLRDIGFLTDDELEQIPEYNTDNVDFGAIYENKDQVLRASFERFKICKEQNIIDAFHNFCDQNNLWLHDFALFMSITNYHEKNGYNGDWTGWEGKIICHNPEELAEWDEKLGEEVLYNKYLQFIFFMQWYELKKYANEKGVKLIGDLPMYVAFDSADVWANPEIFQLNENRKPVVVAGVPNDNPEEEGQKWGNPLYNYEELRKNGYQWMVQRLDKNLELVDIVRLDHFRGFDTYWAIPFESETTQNGEWRETPGEEILQSFVNAFGENLPLIVEDFGNNITERIINLRDNFNLTGMKVLQFAFTSDDNNGYLPQNYEHENFVCYTSTHDNNTVRGWFNNCSEQERENVLRHTQTDGQNINWDIIKMALFSKANTAIYQMQDVLDLDENSRMNNPGTANGNWSWRFKWEMVTPEVKETLRAMTEESGR